MGLGKTLQMIAVLQRKSRREDRYILIVCPASLVYNWAEEFRKFAPELTVCPVEGKQDERSGIIERSGNGMSSPAYDHLKRDIQRNVKTEYSSMKCWMRRSISKPSQPHPPRAVKVVDAKHRFALTGTPIENRLSELWSIFDFLMPGFLYCYESFRNEIEKPITAKEEGSLAPAAMDGSPFILRRLKTEVLKDLPERSRRPHVVRFEESSRSFTTPRCCG